ncbi:T9SS type A sorting domain-containing protein [Flavobacterium sp.]
MKNLYFLFFSILFITTLNAQIIDIPDANFKARLLSASSANQIAYNSSNTAFNVDVNNNGEIEESEALLVYKLNLNSFNYPVTSRISDMTGISAFQNLRILNCFQNSLTQIDILPLTLLEEFEVSYNSLSSLDISNLINLKKVIAHTNQIITFPQNNNIVLENIWLDNNLLTSYDFSVFPALKWISCNSNLLTSVNVSGLLQIDEISLANNSLTSLNLTGLTTLRILFFGGNQINSIDLNTLDSLNMLSCVNNPISSLNLNGHTNLGYLNVNNTLIATVDCSQTGVSQLFASNCPNLLTINVRNGLLSYSDPDLLFFAFTIENNPQLVSICTDDGEQNQLAFYNYNTSGNVTVYNGINCDIPVLVNMSINDFNTTSITLYPNPTSGILNISGNTAINNIKILNHLGQQVIIQKESNAMDISKLPAGTYFVKIETDKEIITKQIIKL